MSKSYFHVEFDMEQSKLPTIMQVLTKEVINLAITSADNRPNITMKTPGKNGSGKKMPSRVLDKPLPEIMADWIRPMPAETTFTIQEARDFLESKGVKPTNASPCLSYCSNQLNLIVSPRRSVFKRTAHK